MHHNFPGMGDEEDSWGTKEPTCHLTGVNFFDWTAERCWFIQRSFSTHPLLARFRTLVDICWITCSKGDKRQTFPLNIILIHYNLNRNDTRAQTGRNMAMLISCKAARIFLYMSFCECSTPISIVLHLLHISREPLSLLIHDTCKFLLVDWDEWFKKWDNETCVLPIRCLVDSWLQESGECVCGANDPSSL